MENIKLKDLKNKVFHFIGIGGISMSALALVLKNRGFHVQGSDIAQTSEVLKLNKDGVKVFFEHKKENLDYVDIVVYTSAIDNENPEIVEAQKQRLILLKRAELLAMIANEYNFVIAISGSHGKTTTTAMLAEMLEKAGRNLGYHIGGVLCSTNSSFKADGEDLFVVEACEYKDNFLFLKPDLAIILNIDSDHLDYFKNIEGVRKSFVKFVSCIENKENIIVCADDKQTSSLFFKSSTFGASKNAELRAVRIREYKPCYFEFVVLFNGSKLGKIRLNVLGKHNIMNALAVIFAGIRLNVPFYCIKKGLENFSGVKRRCEFIGTINGATIYHDYAHHPKQIKKMVVVGKKLVKKQNGKVIVVFEPHTYSRTKFLIKEFVESLSLADKIILAPVYSARELPEMGYDSLKLANDCKEKNSMVEYIETYEEIKQRVEEIAENGDVVLVLGAGSIEKLARLWCK